MSILGPAGYLIIGFITLIGGVSGSYIIHELALHLNQQIRKR